MNGLRILSVNRSYGEIRRAQRTRRTEDGGTTLEQAQSGMVASEGARAWKSTFSLEFASKQLDLAQNGRGICCGAGAALRDHHRVQRHCLPVVSAAAGGHAAVPANAHAHLENTHRVASPRRRCAIGNLNLKAALARQTSSVEFKVGRSRGGPPPPRPYSFTAL